MFAETILKGAHDLDTSQERVRITVQLLDAETDEHLWADRYDRDLRNVLSMQNEIVSAIAREIELQLTPQEQAPLARARPVNPRAYETYLWGRYYWNRRTAQDRHLAREYFQAAIETDPSYAAAYAGLADTYTMLGVYGTLSGKEAGRLAKAAALQALELDAESAQAYRVPSPR